MESSSDKIWLQWLQAVLPYPHGFRVTLPHILFLVTCHNWRGPCQVFLTITHSDPSLDLYGTYCHHSFQVVAGFSKSPLPTHPESTTRGEVSLNKLP